MNTILLICVFSVISPIVGVIIGMLFDRIIHGEWAQLYSTNNIDSASHDHSLICTKEPI